MSSSDFPPNPNLSLPPDDDLRAPPVTPRSGPAKRSFIKGVGNAFKKTHFRVLGLVVVGTVGITLYNFATMKPQTVGENYVPPAPSVSSEAGGTLQNSSPEVQRALVDEHGRKVVQARERGESYVPTLGVNTIEQTPRQITPAAPETQSPVDPRLVGIEPTQGAPQGALSARTQGQQNLPPPPVLGDGNLAKAMDEQMRFIMANVTPKAGAAVAVNSVPPVLVSAPPAGGAPGYQRGGAAGGSGASAPMVPNNGESFIPGQGSVQQQLAAGGEPRQAGGPEELGPVILPAGSILYARVVTSSSSLQPGPVMAEIVSGPLAGSRVLGEFSKANDRLIVRFNTIAPKQALTAESVQSAAFPAAPSAFGTGQARALPYQGTLVLNAIAVDPRTADTSVASDVYSGNFEKYALGFLAAFAEGFGEAAGRGASISISGNGQTVTSQSPLSTEDQLLVAGGKVGERLGRDLDRISQSDRYPIVYLHSGDAIGILLLRDLREGATR